MSAILLSFPQFVPIIPGLFLISPTPYYSRNYSGIIGASLVVSGLENVDPDLIDFQPPKKLLKTSSGRRFNPPATDEDIAILSKVVFLKIPWRVTRGPCECFMTGLLRGTKEPVTALQNVHMTFLRIPKVRYLITGFPGSWARCESKTASRIPRTQYSFTSVRHAEGDDREESQRTEVPWPGRNHFPWFSAFLR